MSARTPLANSVSPLDVESDGAALRQTAIGQHEGRDASETGDRYGAIPCRCREGEAARMPTTSACRSA